MRWLWELLPFRWRQVLLRIWQRSGTIHILRSPLALRARLHHPWEGESFQQNQIMSYDWMNTMQRYREADTVGLWGRGLLKRQKVQWHRADRACYGLVREGGWQFSHLMTPEGISEKITAFLHTELNLPELRDVVALRRRMERMENPFGGAGEDLLLISPGPWLPRTVLEDLARYAGFLREVPEEAWP